MKKLFQQYKGYLPLIAVSVLYILMLHFLQITCPIKWVTGISCPGCGMTRAVLSALRLDFAAAFYYHPLWCVLLPAAVALLILRAKGKMRAFRILLYLLIAAFLAVYLWRIFCGDGIVVAFAPERSLPARIVDYFRR